MSIKLEEKRLLKVIYSPQINNNLREIEGKTFFGNDFTFKTSYFLNALSLISKKRIFLVFMVRVFQNFFHFIAHYKLFYIMTIHDKSEIIGYLIAFIPSKARLNLADIPIVEITYSISESYQNRSIGSYLLAKAISVNQDNDFLTVGLVRETNTASIHVLDRFSKFTTNTNTNTNTKIFNWFFHSYTVPDKDIELLRYSFRSMKPIQDSARGNLLGSATMPNYIRAPYLFYERSIADLIRTDYKVLELGAGTGLHTMALVETKAQVVVSDISPDSLKIVEQRFPNITTEVADIEALPFENNSFDVVTCAGSLSYGDPLLVDAEIKRVLKPNGLFICVDSLNHNPIYRFNRWIHYLRGNRTKSTLQRIPNLHRINALTIGFKKTEVRYFGSISFVMPIISRLFGEEKATHLSDYIDSTFSVQRSAFKFVLVAQDFQK